MKVSVIAASSVIPQVECKLGLKKLEQLGFVIECAENLQDQDFAYAGSDEQRAQHFYQAACSDSDICWAVRGGYGASQILPFIEKLALQQGAIAGKLLIGYSDVTALYQFASQRLGWRILHAPMIASKDFREIKPVAEQALMSLIEQKHTDLKPWQTQPLQWIAKGDLVNRALSAPLFGGNLAVICSMIGTPWQLDFAGKILFLEEIGESWCKIERMLEQLYLAGCLDSCPAIVLGQFIHCRDSSPKGFKDENCAELVDIRSPLTEQQAMHRVFGRLARKLSIPIAFGLSVGHFEKNSSLPLLANYRLSLEEGLSLIDWPSPI